MIFLKSGVSEEWAQKIKENNPSGDVPINNPVCHQWGLLKLGRVNQMNDPILALFQVMADGMNEE